MDKKDYVFIGIIAALFVLLGAGYLINPSAVYDNFLWKYYWGPVVADAQGYPAVHNGVVANEGYTLVSEITYGIIALLSLYYIYRLLNRLNIAIDWRFCLSLIPMILLGPFSRVLEDTGYFNAPLVYWFISPLIYVQIAIYTLIFVVLGWYIETEKKKGYSILAFSFAGATLFSLYLWSLSGMVKKPLHPVFVILTGIGASALVLFELHTRKKIHGETIVFSSGLILFFPALALVVEWAAGIRWSAGAGTRVDVLTVVLVLSAAVTLSVWLIARKFNRAEPYTKPLNLAMVFGHLVDGLTSYISIYDPFNMGIPLYGEKHPVSLKIMEISGGILFPVTKFVLVILIIYLMDIAYREDLKRYANFVNLIKICVFILGMAPGLRDLLRVTLGV